MEGLPVGLIARGRATLRAARRALGREALEVAAYMADVTDEEALRFALDGVMAKFGVPDVLVYNATLGRPHRIGELAVGDPMQSWEVSVGGAMTAATRVLPLMAERGTGAVFLTGALPRPSPGAVDLSPGQAGLRALAEITAAEYGPAGVHVASVMIRGRVAPGTAFDPQQIAEYHWRLYEQRSERWRPFYDYAGIDEHGGRDDLTAGNATVMPVRTA